MKNEIVERLLKLQPNKPHQADAYWWNSAVQAFAERLAEQAVVVTGRGYDCAWVKSPGFNSDTHTALLIDVTPLKKVDPLVEKLRNEYEYWASNGVENLAQTLKEAADRIERFGIKGKA